MDVQERPGISEADVIGLYNAILGREPESQAVISEQQSLGTVEAVGRALVNSDEFLAKRSMQFAKHDLIDHVGILRRHAVEPRHFKPGAITNFIGVNTDVRFCSWVNAGVETGIPVPGNFHASAFEWAAALRAVELAGSSFTVVELGAGWGCWMVNTAYAAKRLGKDVLAIGVEGDEGHVAYIGQHAPANGLQQDEFRAERCVAWNENGYAVFPRSSDSASAYGQEPRFFADRSGADEFVSKDPQAFDVLRAKTLETLCPDVDRIDLLHIDVQGGEADVIRSALEFLNSRVAYIVVGTHGRDLEGAIVATLQAENWVLEIEEPCTLPLPLQSNILYADGLQGWRNSRLT